MTRKLAAFFVALVLCLGVVGPATAAVAPLTADQATTVSNAPSAPTDQTKVPHYFGPYPNWANSPFTLPDATVTISAAALPVAPVTVGNPLIARQYATDNTVGGAGSNTPGQGTVLVVIPTALPEGTLTNFKTFTQNDATFGSPDNVFNAYVLHPTGIPDQYTIAYDSGALTVPAEADGVHTWPVSGSPAVQQGDLIAFYGQGIPLDVDTGADQVFYPSPAAPSGTFFVNDASNFPPLGTFRTYSFAATVQPPGPPATGSGATAEATVGANGAVAALAITDPGSGYAAATVTIDGAGTGATATADVQNSGAVTNVAVDAAGGGYTAPTVTISGGGATTDATAHALGGVDTVSISTSGEAYSFPTVDFDLPDDPAGVQAQGHATCADPYPDCTGAPEMGLLTVTGIVVDNPGSGYTTAPGVFVRDGTQFDPINPPDKFVEATAIATLEIQSVVVDTFGAGYTFAPDVAFGDSGSGAGATATATTDFGAVIALHLVDGGSGYVTPGGIKKFVDTLPGLTEAGANNLGQYIPVAQPDTTTFPDADYYVIGVVQHRERMSSSLPAEGTLLREYVQLSTSVVPGKQVSLVQDNLDGSTSPVMMPDGVTQAVGVDDPHYLGPTIVAQKDRAVRIVFYNLLPKGADGDLFLPTDTSLMGSGDTPDAMNAPFDQGTVTDEVRNPKCTEKYDAPALRVDCFTENRATLHLHGGVTPWISDGTPHQWITPANDSAKWPQGVSVQNVPDMIGAAKPADVPDCDGVDDGCQTFYYTNQQSARLMFYHDHAWGITRLNVYAGEAAGYILTDPTEQKLFGPSGAYAAMGEGIPLVIQDRTFVPSAAQLAGQDPTWDSSKWGGMGDLWYHHVYMPAQNPGDPGGMSAYGRWMYGPWFWPPATPQHGPIDNPYFGKDPKGPDGIMGAPGSPEAADDFTTDLAIPCNLDDPTTWQYQVDPFCEPAQIPGTPNISVGMEQFNDTPLVNGTAYPTTTLDPQSYRFRILNAANDRFWNLSWYVADNNGTPNDPSDDILTEVALNQAEVAAAQTDLNIVPTPDTARSAPGPSWVQFGSEGGFLPAPTVVPPQPTTWITDPTRFDVGNVDKHSLLLAPAERADVIVDFSKFKGKTLILYNDAPAAFPARVPSYDYYTGGPDTGAGVVLPGYGPNTRTVMQLKINDVPEAAAFNVNNFKNVFTHKANGSGVFEASQDPIIVGQAAYNSAYGKSFVASGDCTNPTGTNKCDGMARINQQGGQDFRFDTLKGPQLKVAIQPKAIHDEMNSAAFDEFGRMTANLGLEAVPATPAGQNVLLYPYIAPPTEVIDGTNLPKGDLNIQPIGSGTDGTQIWKITHNGVDTHPIHFHLFNVQLLNRVTWDNIIIPTEPSELGWKETVRISPLEDTIVALRPIVPTLPFEVPNAIRPLSPMMPLGADLDPNGLIVDPNGNVTTVTNALVNFGWEYVYHCHILSHEEMDMMRPVLLALPPLKADTLVFDKVTTTLNFKDQSITETSFVVQRRVDGTTAWTDVGTIDSPLDVPNVHQDRSLVDPTYDPYTDYQYRVMARNMVGAANSATTGFAATTVFSLSDPITVLNPPKAPSALTGTLSFGPTITLTWTDNATTETGFRIERRLNGGAFAPIGAVGANVTSFVDTVANGLTPSATFGYRVIATNAIGDSQASNTFPQVVPAPPAAPTLMTATLAAGANGPVMNLSFRDNANNETGFIVERSVDGGAFSKLGATLPARTSGNATVTMTDTTIAAGAAVTTYSYRVTAINAAVQSAYSNVASADVPILPAVPTSFTAANAANSGGQRNVTLTWAADTTNVTGFTIQRSTNATFANGVTTTNVASTATTLTVSGLSRNTAYYFRIRANNGAVVSSAWLPATPSPITTNP
jgi:FtsP/CotA-like multicopper oxidase with cupredoxin domain